MSKESIKQKAEATLKYINEEMIKPNLKEEGGTKFYIIDLSSLIGEVITAPSQDEVINKAKERLKELIKVQDEKIANKGIKPLSKKISNIYQWSNKLTAEARDWAYFNEAYYWPGEVKRLLVKIRMAKGALIGVMGNQGIGKSSAMQALWSSLSNSKICPEVKGKSIVLKWPESGNLMQAIQEAFLDEFEEEYKKVLIEKLEALVTNNKKLRYKLNELLNSYQDNTNIYHFIAGLLGLITDSWDRPLPSIEFLESLLSKSICKELKEKATIQMLFKAHSVMIDLPDYSRSDKRMMARDLDEVQSLWNKALTFDAPYSGNVSGVNFIIFVQKELLHGSHGLSHYLFGKMDIVEIKPLTPQQLIDVYLKKFKDHYPFTSDALMRLARLSRGIFRRFLRYISLCLEELMIQGNDQLIDLSFTEKTITNEEVSKDMDLELSALFPKGEMKKKAVKTIIYLMGLKEGLNQKQLAKALNFNETDISNICDKLEDHGYLIRESSKEGKIVRGNI